MNEEAKYTNWFYWDGYEDGYKIGYEESYKESFQEGYEESFQKSYKEGLKEGRKEVWKKFREDLLDSAANYGPDAIRLIEDIFCETERLLAQAESAEPANELSDLSH